MVKLIELMVVSVTPVPLTTKSAAATVALSKVSVNVSFIEALFVSSAFLLVFQAFAATTGAVKDHHFDAVFDAYIADEKVRAFMAKANPAALKETAARLAEALRRDLWKPRSNQAHTLLDRLSEATDVGAA